MDWTDIGLVYNSIRDLYVETEMRPDFLLQVSVNKAVD